MAETRLELNKTEESDHVRRNSSGEKHSPRVKKLIETDKQIIEKLPPKCEEVTSPRSSTPRRDSSASKLRVQLFDGKSNAEKIETPRGSTEKGSETPGITSPRT